MVQNRHGAEHSGHAEKLMYLVLAAAGASATAVSLSSPRVTGDVGGNRAGLELVNQIVVLGLLGSGKLEAENLLVLRLDLCILRSHFLRGQLVQNCAGVGVSVLQQVTGASLDGVPGITALRGQVVIGICKASLYLPLGITATGGKLGLDSVAALHDCHLGGVAVGQDGGIDPIEALTHGILHTIDLLGGSVEAITQALLHGVQLALHLGKVRGEDVIVDGPGAGGSRAVTVAAPTVAVPIIHHEPSLPQPIPPLPLEIVPVGVTFITAGIPPSFPRDINFSPFKF